MERFYIVSNMIKDPNLAFAKKLQAYLIDSGKECLCREREGKRGEESHVYTDAAQVPDNVDCVLVLGGDGTLIQAARDLVRKKIPLFGINLGTLGYLTEVGQSSAFQALDKLIRDECFVEERMMLKGEAGRENLWRDRALNDIVITGEKPMQVTRLKVSVNGEFLAEYAADGLVLSTPTGSTAYSLSAGGPIVEPTAALILITPISPHTMHNRTIVLQPGANVEVEVDPSQNGDCVIFCDGVEGAHLMPGERTMVRRSRHTVKILRISKVGFLETLRKKLK